jgi:hypothetical protein
LAGQIGPPQTPVDIEVGARYWYSWGHDKINLFDPTGTFQVSRLTWQNMKGNSLEGFFRANTKMGVFVKGYLGGMETFRTRIFRSPSVPFRARTVPPREI